ncbi:MAG: hypothetical protein DHS20C09_12460 [marine bacterium B5-7]|nr:MAG: hypothetical protein DHS20C09_12460 [marine bacterium B5-7]
MSIRTIRIYAILITLFVSVNVPAVILNTEEAEQADLILLEDEAKVFQSIGLGIALSLAQCDGIDLCSLNVEEGEIRELLKTLESRVGSLILKQEEAEDPAGVDDVLTAYMNERDSYHAYLEKLQRITNTLDSDIDLLEDADEMEVDFPVESARNEELNDYLDELEAFDDEELEDDEDLEDLPDLPELDDINSTP